MLGWSSGRRVMEFVAGSMMAGAFLPLSKQLVARGRRCWIPTQLHRLATPMFAVAVALGCAVPALAEVVTARFTGTTTQLVFPGSTYFRGGEPIEVTFDIDLDAIDQYPSDPDLSWFNAVSNLRFSIGDYFVTGAKGVVTISNDSLVTPGRYRDILYIYANVAGTAPDLPGGFPVSMVDLMLFSDSQEFPGAWDFLDSDQLPQSFDVDVIPKGSWPRLLVSFQNCATCMNGGLTGAAGASGNISGGWSYTPTGQLEDLRDSATGVGPGKSLANKVALAQAYYAVPDIQATCAMLSAFGSEVWAQRGKKIAVELADALTADAQAIMTAMGCE